MNSEAIARAAAREARLRADMAGRLAQEEDRKKAELAQEEARKRADMAARLAQEEARLKGELAARHQQEEVAKVKAWEQEVSCFE